MREKYVVFGHWMLCSLLGFTERRDETFQKGRTMSGNYRKLECSFAIPMNPHGDHPKNVNKLTNTLYSASEQQYQDLSVCLKYLSGQDEHLLKSL